MHRVRRTRERGHDAVALTLLLGPHAAVCGDRRSDDLVVALHRGSHCVCIGLPQQRGALDVGEQERHGSDRQPAPLRPAARHLDRPQRRPGRRRRIEGTVVHLRRSAHARSRAPPGPTREVRPRRHRGLSPDAGRWALRDRRWRNGGRCTWQRHWESRGDGVGRCRHRARCARGHGRTSPVRGTRDVRRRPFETEPRTSLRDPAVKTARNGTDDIPVPPCDHLRVSRETPPFAGSSTSGQWCRQPACATPCTGC